jgi:hypothetical protein
MKKILYALAMLVVFSSCENDFEYKFDKPVSERIQESNSNLTSLLSESEFGWKGVVKGGNVKTGGSFIAFKFTRNEGENNGTVLMNSGFEEEISEFAISHQEGTILQFNTPNDVLYWMIEPRDWASAGLGAEKEYIFMKEEDGKLVFRGKENDADLVLEKAVEQDWDMTAIHANFDNYTARDIYRYNAIRITGGFNGASEENPFDLRLSNAGWTVENKEEFGYGLTYTIDGKDIEQQQSTYIFTHEGVMLSNPIAIGGDTITKLVFDEQKDKWVVGDKGIVGEFMTSRLPIYTTPGVVDALFVKSLSTADRSGIRGMMLKAYGSEGPMYDYAKSALKNKVGTGVSKLLAVMGYVNPDGENLGDGLVFSTRDGKSFAFIPVAYEKLSENSFRIIRQEGDVITNIEGAAEIIATDVDINAYFDILCSEQGWSMAMDYFSFGMYQMTTFELGNIEDPLNWFSATVVMIAGS